MKIKNTDDGPRGVFTEDGLVTLAPGEVADVKLSKAEADGLAPYFEHVKPAAQKADGDKRA
jgi:hypothetical protein